MSEEPDRKSPSPRSRVARVALSREGRGESARIKPSKNRLLQATRTPNRKLFDAARRAVFLECFAATCNVRLSAARAGVAYGTVFRHRMKDTEFAAAWDAALAQGYAYLEARLLEEAIGRGDGRAIESSERTGPLPSQGCDANFDPELALTLMREHARRLPGSGDKRKRQRFPVTVATHEEVVAALTRRLKTFAVRGRASQTE